MIVCDNNCEYCNHSQACLNGEPVMTPQDQEEELAHIDFLIKNIK